MTCAEAEARFKCFLHYGSDERMYIPCPVLKKDFNLSCLKSSLKEILENEDALKNVVPTVVKVFRGGYSVEPCASLYALAVLIRKASTNYKVMNEAYKAARKLSEDNAEHFLIFSYYLREVAKLDRKKGFGKGWRVTVQKWYESKDALQLAQLATKINSVMTWSHADVITLSRLKPPEDPAKAAIMEYLRNGYQSANNKYSSISEAKPILEFLKLVHNIRCAKTESAVVDLISMQNFSIEYCPTKFLTSSEVWMVLIPRMSIDDLLSNINRMSKLKMFGYRDLVREVINRCQRLDTVDAVHPIQVYILQKNYELGPNLAIEFQYLQRRRAIENSMEGGDDNSGINVADIDQQVQRQPPPRRIPELIECMSTLFVKSLSLLAPTGLRYLIALDSQTTTENRVCYKQRFVTVEEAASLVALCVIKAEPESNVKLVTFTKEESVVKELPINKAEESLETIKNKINRDESGLANLTELIRWATNEKEKFDIIILLSDYTLLVNGAHEALKLYQQTVSEKAKVVTCCFSGFHKKYRELTKSDMFLICGFDKNVGRLIDAYSRGAF